jgi:predicted alpha-1,2-mannosidase
VRYLDKLFTMELPEEFYAHSEDINRVGIIGNYIHGNEPSHHVPYLYVYAGKPEKTQARVRYIVDHMYKETPDGMCGNDDCGQMSAWYVFSVLGFYPVCPGSGEYAIGTPCVPEARIALENGRVFIIKAPDVSERNIYIQSMKLNGKKLDRYFLRHADIINGGELIFAMGSSPDKR